MESTVLFNVCYYPDTVDVSAHLTTVILRAKMMAKKNSAWRSQSNWLPFTVLEEETCSDLVLCLWHDSLAASWCWARITYCKVTDKNRVMKTQSKKAMFFVQPKVFKTELQLYLNLHCPLHTAVHISLALRSRPKALTISDHKSTAWSSQVSLTSTRWRSKLTQFFSVSGKSPGMSAVEGL